MFEKNIYKKNIFLTNTVSTKLQSLPTLRSQRPFILCSTLDKAE